MRKADKTVFQEQPCVLEGIYCWPISQDVCMIKKDFKKRRMNECLCMHNIFLNFKYYRFYFIFPSTEHSLNCHLQIWSTSPFISLQKMPDENNFMFAQNGMRITAECYSFSVSTSGQSSSSTSVCKPGNSPAACRYLGRSWAIFSTKIAVQITTRLNKCGSMWTHSASAGELHMTKGWFQFSRSRNRIANLLQFQPNSWMESSDSTQDL